VRCGGRPNLDKGKETSLIASGQEILKDTSEILEPPLLGRLKKDRFRDKVPDSSEGLMEEVKAGGTTDALEGEQCVSHAEKNDRSLKKLLPSSQHRPEGGVREGVLG